MLHRLTAAGRRRLRLGALLALVSALVSALLTTTATADSGGGTIAPVRLSLLQPDVSKASVYRAAGIDMVTLELGWDAYQPAPGTTDRDYVARQVRTAEAFRSAGLGVVLDLGVQYPPAWAFDLSSATRFVDQYGTAWHGDTGTDVLNAVWEPLARQAEAAYVRQVATDFTGIPFVSVRVGGLLSGEVRLPPPTSAGHSDSMWGFDPRARAASPVSGWSPGTGTPSDAAAWVDFYLGSLADFEVWLARTVADSFPGTPLDVLMPGWGMRPGDTQTAIDALAVTGSPGRVVAEVGPGLDWARQTAALAATGLDITLVTTWLDAPSYGSSARDESPADHLARLAAQHGLPISGENTGGGGQAALDRVVAQAAALPITRVTWMSAGSLTSGGGVTLTDLRRAFPPAVAPAAPTGVTARRLDVWVVVSWQPPPTDGGSPVTRFTVSMSATGSSVTAPADSSAVLFRVAPGTSPSFTVTAANGSGTSPSSAPVTVVNGAAGGSWIVAAVPGGRLFTSPDGREFFLVSAEGVVLSHALGQGPGRRDADPAPVATTSRGELAAPPAMPAAAALDVPDAGPLAHSRPGTAVGDCRETVTTAAAAVSSAGWAATPPAQTAAGVLIDYLRLLMNAPADAPQTSGCIPR